MYNLRCKTLEYTFQTFFSWRSNEGNKGSGNMRGSVSYSRFPLLDIAGHKAGYSRVLPLAFPPPPFPHTNPFPDHRYFYTLLTARKAPSGICLLRKNVGITMQVFCLGVFTAVLSRADSGVMCRLTGRGEADPGSRRACD